MRIFGIILVVGAFPLFMALLRVPSYRRWAFFALGALPILHIPLNLDAALVSWSLWQGHTRGLLLTIIDPLALAICLRDARGRPSPPLLWAFGIYLICLVPGLFAGGFTPALFFFFQSLRITVFFYAVYLAVHGGQAMRVAEGLAIAAIASGAVSVYQGFSGALQAQGILGHQNLSGLATNLCAPILFALGLTTKRRLFLIAVAATAMGAIAGGSRGTIILLGVSLAGTLAAVVVTKPDGRRLTLAVFMAICLAAAAPFAIHKLNERNAGFEKDPERIAFEHTAELMIADYPWGVGLNQYVRMANLNGYFDKAGVRWGFEARSTNVHNVYLLIRAEAGLIGLLGFLVWLLSPVLLAASALLRRQMVLREVSLACSFAIATAALHSRYEWVLLTATPQYLVALMMGMIAAVAAYSKQARLIKVRLRETKGEPKSGQDCVPTKLTGG